jgi:hypothetical protein
MCDYPREVSWNKVIFVTVDDEIKERAINVGGEGLHAEADFDKEIGGNDKSFVEFLTELILIN